MPTLADLRGFDAGRFIQMGQAGQRQRTLADIGQAASTGDFRGAQSAAFAGGENDIGMKLKSMNDQDKMQLVEQAASWAYDASDPQKWEAGRAMWRAKGFDPGPFEGRGVLLSQAQTVQQKMAQANADRSYGLDREKVAQAGPSGPGEYGLNPILVDDGQGNLVPYQTSKRGGAQPIPLPPGSRVVNPFDRASMGAGGKAQGTAAAGLPIAEASADRIIRGIDDVLADPALDSVVGPIEGRLPRWTGDSSRAQSRIDQVLGGTFLQAYSDLRGGGAITEKEGEKAQAAYNRLNTITMNDADYRKALNDFKAEVMKLRDIARQRAGQGAGSTPYNPLDMRGGAQPAAPQPSADGWQDLGNGVRIRQVQ